MTELERRVEACSCDVETAKLELQKADNELRHGERHLAEAREKYGNLKVAVELARVRLRKEQSWLAAAKAEAAKGYSAT